MNRLSIVLALLACACSRRATGVEVDSGSSSSASAALQATTWKGVALAKSDVAASGSLLPAAPVPRAGPFVVVSPVELRLGDEKLAPLPPKESWAHGLDGAYKKSSALDLFLVPLGAKLDGGSGGDASVVLDASIPYRIFGEVLFTLGQSSVGTFHLLVRAGESNDVATIDVMTPRVTGSVTAGQLRGLSAGPPKALELSVVIGADGFTVRTSAGKLAPDCKTTAAGTPTVPLRDGAFDFAGLRRCAMAAKAAAPTPASEDTFTLVASPSTEYQAIVSTLDALRVNAEHTAALFPHVHFGMPM